MRTLTTILLCAIAMFASISIVDAQNNQLAELGATVATITPEIMAERQLSIPFGALIVSLEPGGPSERADLRRGDVLIAIGSQKILSQQDLEEALSRASGGAKIELTYVREGQVHATEVVLSEAKNPMVPSNTPYLMLDTGGHMGIIRGLTFTSDGRQVVSASQDKVIRVWDWRSGKTVRTIRGNVGTSEEGKILALALSPDNKLLAVAGVMGPRSGQGPDRSVGAIRIYDFGSGELRTLLMGHTNA